jgi:putative PEP-CTERM system histidine kinase
MLSFNLIISFCAAFLSALIAAFILYRDPHPLVHKIFAAGMTVLGVEAALSGLSLGERDISAMVAWQQWRILATAFLPCLWLAFSLTYGRVDYWERLKRWGLTLASFLVLPWALIFVYRRNLFAPIPVWIPNSGWGIPLGWSGYAFTLILLVAFILILLELEKTLRGSRGIMRWQIKFTVLGLMALFGTQLFTASQNILYRSINLDLTIVNNAALIIAGIFLLRSLFRTRFFSAALYVSQNVLYNSFTLLIIGFYFIAIGLLAKLSIKWSVGFSLPIVAFLLLLALVGFTIIIFSDRLRRRIKLFISRNFHRPLYDYRKEWVRFTEETTAVRNIQELCQTVTRMVSEILHFLSVTIWLIEEPGGGLSWGGSTAITSKEAKSLRRYENAYKELTEFLKTESDPLDFGTDFNSWSINLPALDYEFLQAAQIRYVVPLRAGNNLIGILALDQRVANDMLTLEDFDLLKTIADQTATAMNQLRLVEKLQQTRELEAFQTMSTFFIHDLKNVASRLSLTMQNLPDHFDNPEFRQDAIKGIGQSLEKINTMCSRLSSLQERIEVHLKEEDLNTVVQEIVAEFSGTIQCKLDQELMPLPKVLIDPEQFSKVLVNLILNAGEALTVRNGMGEIRVSTVRAGKWVELSIKDNGPGMSQEFIERSLFQPFKTTKKQGMGIGLFQSKMIVEAHQGRLEVESIEGEGTIFRVLLPAKSVG